MGALRMFKPWAVPMSRQHLQQAGFFTAFLWPMAVFTWAMQDPASVNEARLRAERRRAWLGK
ncbi:hypothetical protein PV11_06986 [Exophiala sideris]|uniref:Uncharacterized protein n=1 Tax=Exophiala sideris TaxID=1016849 RepID=A0A0D1YF14_9EURO|nr:hypothetical protein PV11_06986 [Exophiala sideris]